MPLTLEQKKDYSIKYIKEVIENRHFDLIEEIVHEDYYPVPQVNLISCREKLMKRLKLWTQTFEEKFDIVQVIGEGNSICVKFRTQTKQIKPWFELEPKGRTAKTTSVQIFNFFENKIISSELIENYHDLMSKLGHEEIFNDNYLINMLDFEHVSSNQETQTIQTGRSLIICAWCYGLINRYDDNSDQRRISHGICSSCSIEYF